MRQGNPAAVPAFFFRSVDLFCGNMTLTRCRSALFAHLGEMTCEYV